MQIPKRVIRIAKEKALSGFTALTENTLTEADALLTQAIATAAGGEQRGASAARVFLRTEGSALRSKMETFYAAYLERAMQTMHTDLRAGLHDIRADSLSLIDDDVVTRQIEVDRLVMRLRDAEQLSLGRINLIIAQLHGESEVRERENPFRPYLLARALHEGLRDLVKDESQSRLLFDTLSAAMTSKLPGFYEAIHQVFESGGLSSRLLARPSEMSRAQRDRLAWQRAAEQTLNKIGTAPAAAAVPASDLSQQARMMPLLQRLMDMHGQAAPQAGAPQTAMPQQGATQQHAVDLQEMIWNIFNQHSHQNAVRRPRDLALESEQADDAAPAQSAGQEPVEEAQGQLPFAAPLPPSPLDMRLRDLQHKAAGTPLEVREQIGDAETEPAERLTLDLMALLFESIVHDEQIPASIREQMNRLHLPFVRAAVQQPSLVQNASHPARRLLDRIGSVAVGIGTDAACFPLLEQEIGKVVGQLQAGFDNDVSAFSKAENALDEFVAATLPRGDRSLALCVSAINEAEAASARLFDAANALEKLLTPLDVDPRVGDFVATTWARVLAHPGRGAECIALLPELLWSAQEKTTPSDRSILMRMLPDIVRRVREGLNMIGLPEPLAKAALDQLVAVHMDVLGNKQVWAPATKSLEQLRSHFASFDPQRGVKRGDDDLVVPVTQVELENALRLRGVDAELQTEPQVTDGHASDAQWLRAARPGAGFEMLKDGAYTTLRLSAVSARQGVFLFNGAGNAKPVIYVQSAMLAALQAGTLRPVEYAPVFDRAVEYLMAGAETVAPGTQA